MKWVDPSQSVVSAVWLQTGEYASQICAGRREISVSALPLPCVHIIQPGGAELNTSCLPSDSSFTCGSQLGAKPQLQFSVIKSENLPRSYQFPIVWKILHFFIACLTGKSTFLWNVSLSQSVQSQTTSQHNQMLNTTALCSASDVRVRGRGRADLLASALTKRN